MSVLKWAECHVTLANEGALFSFSFFFFFPFPLASREPPSELMGVMSKTTSAHGASYSWPKCHVGFLAA